MKKLLIATSCILGSFAAMAGPVDPMENFYPTEVKAADVDRLWNSMRTDLKGDDCYKRAHLWSYALDRRYRVKTSKIFLHYTDKFNLELDQLGDEGGGGLFGRLGRKVGLKDDIDGLSPRTQGMVKSNITWDYHVAPVLNVEGEKVVMDRYLELPYNAKFPYSEDEAWDLEAKPASVEEWVEGLTVRGELLWQARRQQLLNKIDKYQRKADKKKKYKKKRKYLKKVAAYKAEMRRLGMDKSDQIDIKCEKVTTIAEVDAAQKTAWCFYSEAPMYYWNEIDLRLLAYGNNTGYRYQMAVPVSVQTEANFREGRKYIKRSFEKKELEISEGEIKSSSRN